MHLYSSASNSKPKLVAGIAFVALALNELLRRAVSATIPALAEYTSGLSAMAMFGALYFCVDRWAWRPRKVRRALLVPDLGGRWRCVGRTLAQNGTAPEREWSATVVIKQSWTRIAVVLETKTSRSHSIAAALLEEPDGGFRLVYTYENEPSPQESHLQRHVGTARLRFDAEAQVGEGDYFTGRDRYTFGMMKLTRGVPTA